MSGLRVETRDEIEPLASAWEELAERTCAMPFMRPGWISAWWRAFGRGPLVVLTVWREGQLVALLPLERRGPALVATSNEHTPWFAPLAADREAAETLGSALVAQRAPRIVIDGLLADEEPSRALLDALGAAGYRRLEHPMRSLYVPTADGWDTYLDGLSRSRRQDIRRRLRQLGSIGPVRLDVDDGTADGLQARLDAGLDLEHRGWKGSRGTAVASDAVTRRFYGDVADWAARAGILRLVTLRAGDRDVAFTMNVRARGRAYGMKMGYDPELRRYGPGVLLAYLLIEEAFTTGLQSFELLGWDEPWKRSLAHDVRTGLDLRAYAPGIAGSAAWAAARSRRSLQRAGASVYRRVRRGATRAQA